MGGIENPNLKKHFDIYEGGSPFIFEKFFPKKIL